MRPAEREAACISHPCSTLNWKPNPKNAHHTLLSLQVKKTHDSIPEKRHLDGAWILLKCLNASREQQVLRYPLYMLGSWAIFINWIMWNGPPWKSTSKPALDFLPCSPPRGRAGILAPTGPRGLGTCIYLADHLAGMHDPFRKSLKLFASVAGNLFPFFSNLNPLFRSHQKASHLSFPLVIHSQQQRPSAKVGPR